MADRSSRELIDDLDALLAALPPEIVAAIHALPERTDLIEVVMDLGRRPEARFPDSEVTLLDREIDEADIAHVVDKIGSFGDDNRAGIERTLHRISAIRNRTGKIVGLTCRIGRAVYGTIDIIDDFVETGKSILIMGRPGIGKTTMLREAARVLADDLGKRVVVVDTSNEIAGDGDIPHPAIGKARRMQVRTPALQHEVMIEAVENHMPQVIVIDEIGTELEAQAARTIAERGVQLIGTAHGNNLDNLMLNPTLSDLIGGIQSVTLGDEEARRRRTQKSVLERKAPPTFDVIVEIQDREKVMVHADVAETVDAMLRGDPSRPSSGGRTRPASTRRSPGHDPRRASWAATRWDASGSPGSSARAGVAGAPSPPGAEPATTAPRPGIRRAGPGRAIDRARPAAGASRGAGPARRAAGRCPASGSPAMTSAEGRADSVPGAHGAGRPAGGRAGARGAPARAATPAGRQAHGRAPSRRRSSSARLPTADRSSARRRPRPRWTGAPARPASGSARRNGATRHRAPSRRSRQRRGPAPRTPPTSRAPLTWRAPPTGRALPACRPPPTA